MKKSDRVWAGTGVLLVLVLLPAVVAFWYLLGGVMKRSAASETTRMLALIMNQADRLTFDLDLELSLLDSYMMKSGSGSGFDDSVAEYAASARWPALVRAFYAVEPASGGEGVAVRRLLPSAGSDDPYAESIGRTYRYAFEPGPREAPPGGEAIPPAGDKIPPCGEAIPPGGDAAPEARAPLTRAVPAPVEGLPGESARRLLVAVLDEEVLAGEVLPALVVRYFTDSEDFSAFRVGVRDASGAYRYESASMADSRPDFARPLLRDAGRFDVAGFYSAFAPRLGGLEPPDRGDGPGSTESPGDASLLIDRYRFQSTGERGAWTLDVAMKRGTIAESARRRAGLWSLASAGFLALLYGSVLALYLSALRAAGLASRERAFVASVTHELKTPIAVALSAGENLAKGIVPGDRVAEYGAVVARESRRLADSVERLLVVAGLESAQPFRRGEPLPMADLAARAIAGLEPYARDRGASFALDVEGSPVADGSRVLVESALECVFSNAVKYAGGPIRVSVRQLKARGQRLVVVECADSGPGVPRAERPHLFEPFYRGRAALEAGAPGTGIGLYLARRIARIHGGNVVMRFPGEGGTVVESTFRSYP